MAASITATLLYSKSSKQILLLEARKELVDLILGFLTLPMGCVVKLLADAERGEKALNASTKPGADTGEYKGSTQAPHRALSGITSLFESIEKLEDARFCTPKKCLTDPRPVIPWGGKIVALGRAEGSSAARGSGFFCCNSGPCDYISSRCDKKCPKHRKKMETTCKLIIDDDNSSAPSQIQSPKGKRSQDDHQLIRGFQRDHRNSCSSPGPTDASACDSITGGFVKQDITFMITNSLEIFPSSTINSIVRLSTLKSEKLGDLDTIEISVGSEEILQLLRASIISTNILNDVFSKYCKKGL